jgi:hypothetical protein
LASSLALQLQISVEFASLTLAIFQGPLRFYRPFADFSGSI